MPNGIPVELHDQLDFSDGKRLDFPRLIYYLRDCKIPNQVVLTTDAPRGAWYPMV
jgi:phosphodiesterase/alkaline phosphatase D-like protein